MKIKELTLTGTPFERGLQYGAECREEIRRSMQSYELLFGRKGISWEAAKERATRFIAVIEETDPRYVEEMKGIAQGAGVAFLDVLAINCRSELLYAPAPQECTAFSLIPPATADGMVWAGQSWDYIRSQREALVILRIPAEENRPSLLLFAEAGMIGGKGMNSAGLALTLNALSTQESGFGLPLHVRMRRILEQDSLQKGYEVAVQGGHPSPVNWILTHRDGHALGLEVQCNGVDLLEPRNGAIFHTNHFVGPKFGVNINSGGSYLRQQRIQQLLGGRSDVTLEEIKAALADHANAPSSICKHTTAEDEAEAMKQHATNHTLIMDLLAGEAHFSLGNSCEGEYRLLKTEG